MKKTILFDRKEHLAILEKRINGLKEGYRQNIAIIGDELVGKTSIIFNLLNRLNDNQIIPIYLEIRAESISAFGKRFIAVLLYNFLNNSDIPIKEDLGFLINKSQTYIPKTTEKINEILSDLDKKKRENIFAEILSLCDIIHQETKKHCVVILDEFHNLEHLGIKKLYQEWSNILMLQKNTLYIIISSLKYKAKAILTKELNLLFGNFEIIFVEPFDIKSTEKFIEPAARELNLSNAHKNFLVHFTGGYPFYLEAILDALRKSNTGNLNLVDSLEELMFSPSGTLNQRFTTGLKKLEDTYQKEDFLSILYLISDGHNKTKDIAHMLHKTKKEIDLKTNKLLETDSISRSGDFLKITDRVFSFWLKFVHQQKMNSLTFDAKNQKNLFRQKIEEMFQEFITSTKKPVPERIMELMHLFQDEQIQIEKKKIRLNHFREIKSLEFNNKHLRDGLICRSSDSTWIIGFKYDMLTEDDISEFSRECKKFRHKLEKKIIVTFQDVEPNSRLKAMEEKITTWDVNNLNHILDLFYKPRIVA